MTLEFHTNSVNISRHVRSVNNITEKRELVFGFSSYR